MKINNVGKNCVLKVLTNNIKPINGPIIDLTSDDLFPFFIVGFYRGGYEIQRVEYTLSKPYGGIFRVKTKDIIIIH